jgi:hypothetical protein
MEDKNSVYPYAYSYKGKCGYLLWGSNGDGDVFKKHQDKLILSVGDFEEAKKIFAGLSFAIKWDEAAIIDFDVFWKILSGLGSGSIIDETACEVMLNGWNFIEDLIRTFALDALREKLHEPQLNKVYEKFFYGCNIAAVTPSRCGYTPLWQPQEVLMLRARLADVWDELGGKSGLW